MYLRTICLVTAALALAACGQVPYRTRDFSPDADCRALYNRIDDLTRENKSVTAQERSSPCWFRPIEERDAYDMLFVEFDDQGWVRDSHNLERPAKEDFLDAFYGQLKRIYDQNRDNGLSIVVYIHGWHHNASAEDDNVTNFRRFTRDIAVAENLVNRGKKAPRVVGIYIGWRGESITLPYVNGITFWDRKNTAERVAQGSVRELFTRLDFLRGRARTGLAFDGVRDNVEAKDGARNVRMLTIAHSFGGLIAFEALSGEFMRSAARATGDDYVSRLGDLVMIVNPAFEGARFEPLMAAAQRIRELKHNQLPVVIVATSTADWATRSAFPLARQVSTLLERTPGAEDHAIIYAVGHNARFRTHWLRPCDKTDKECDQACPDVASLAPEKGAGAHASRISAEFELMKHLGSNGLKSQGAQHLCSRLELTSTSNWKPDKNPFWVVSTDGTIMSGHNDIFNPLFVSFMRQMYYGVIAERFK